jgi:hypothetical protein
VSAGGLVTVVGLGTANITARINALVATRVVDALFPASKVTLTGNVLLTAPGETSQLRATAELTAGGTADVTNHATWTAMTIPSVIEISRGLVTATGLGWGQINATYGGRVAATPVTVTPPGTYVIRGFVKQPGHAGMSGFRIVDTSSGRTTESNTTGPNAPGWYTLGGLLGSTRITYDKAGFEPAELIVTGPAVNGGGEVKVQQLYRVSAGAAVQTTIAPHDVAYDVSPGGPCLNCRMIRVVTPASGMLHVNLTWTAPAVAMNLWTGGQLFTGSPGGPIVVDVPVGAGETVLYAGVGGDFGYVTLSMATSFAADLPFLVRPGLRAAAGAAPVRPR